MEDRVHPYVDRLDLYLVRDRTIASLNKDMEIARMQDFAQKLEDRKQKSESRGSRTTGYPEQGSTSQSLTPRQPCKQCGRSHLGICRIGTDASYWCGMPGQLMINCPKRRMSDIAQPTGSAVASLSSMPHLGRGLRVPTGPGRGVRGAASSRRVQNRTYALGS
ncbi:uncharacterized protein LOC125829034 [Solanum verrucosum]|uniref:uncharacterized protein LOC125829034 n=1 Tax=Solanum verrucosum TaxID=315347 RepID=UPI0020CFECBC|nr:uncharacterized protein LOC125829034 [Solanum verrucosum]